jgi:CelD/BcsL family acetyltransferase involved in cellulose biosynthesis
MSHAALTGTVNAERFEVVDSAEQLAAVGPAWSALWQSLDGFIFQSHAWISAWWDTVPDQEQRSLRIGLLWREERLVAVMPLAICRRKGLRFLEWAAASYTDYGDILAAPDCSDQTLQSLMSHLCRLGGFDLAYLSRLLPQAAARKLTRRGLAGVSLQPNHRQEISYRVAGEWQTGSQWFDGQSKKARQNYRRGVKLIEQTGTLRFRLMRPDEPLQPVLDRLSALKRKWLADNALQSDLYIDGAATLAALVAAIAEAGILRIFVLECQDVAIAISINFVQHGTMMAFVTTYDPDFERASPGVLLMTDYIKWSIDHGLHTVDFLCGAEPFKHRFATQSVCLTSVMGAGTIKGRIALLVDRSRNGVNTSKIFKRARRPATVDAD